MKKLMIGLAYGALLVAVALGGYVWGWYQGLNYHAVVSGMSEAKWSLSAAQSLRQRDPGLALELLEANISWVDATLQLEPADVPSQERANYDIVLRRLAEYKAAYGRSDSN